MAQDQISQLFNIQEIEANAQKALDVVREKVVEINKLQEQILKSDSASSNNSNAKASAANMQELTNAVKEYTNATKLALAARNQDGQSISDLEEKINRLTAKLKEKVVVTASSNKEAKLEAIAASELANAYEKLDAQHKLAVISYQKLAASGKASAAQLSAQKDAANALGDQLDKIDQATGNYRRKVGNYSSAWNGLGNSINQVTRELPNFAQSFQLGLLAISNNLPILQDELGRAREKIDDLKKAGKDAPSIFSQIASSIFSWQTAFTIGITLALKYSDVLIDLITNTSEAEKAQNNYNKALSESIKTESNNINTLLIAKSTINDNTKSRNEQISALYEAQKLFPAYLGGLNLEKNSLSDINKALDEQIQLRVDNAKQVALNKLLAQSTEEIITAQIKLNDTPSFFGRLRSEVAALKVVDQAYKGLTDNAKSLVDAEGKRNESMGKGNTITKSAYEHIIALSDAEKKREAILKISTTEEEKNIDAINEQIKTLQARRKEHEQDIKGFSSINETNRKEKAGIDLIIDGLNAQIDALQKLRQEKLNSQLANTRLIKDPLQLELDRVNAQIKIAKDGSAKEIELQKESADITLKMKIRELNELYYQNTSYQKINLASNAEYMKRIQIAEDEHKGTLSEISQRLEEKNRKQANKNAKELQKEQEQRMKEAIAAQKAIAENESNTYDVRYEAATKYSKLSMDLIKFQGKNTVDNLILIATETDKLITKNNEDQIKQLEKFSKEKAQIILEQMNNITQNENIDRDKRLNALDEEFAKGKMKTTKYNAERQKINEEYDAKILQNQIDALREYLKEAGLQPSEISKIEEKITDLTNQQLDKRRKRRNLDAEEKEKLREKEKDYEIQIIKEVTNFIFDSLKRRNDQELKALEQQKTAISETYDLKRKAIEDAAISEEEKAKRKAVLDAEEAYRQTELDKLIREQKRKQAILDKAQALATIAINTAVAAASVTNLSLGGLLTPLILALGAAQAASVIATPIPEYAKGKKSTDSYEGLAIAGEAGTELLIDKDGKSTLLDKPTLIHTRRGDTILSNEQLKKGATANNTTSGYKLSNEDIINALGYNIGALRKDIRNQGERVIPIDQTRYFDLRRAARK